MPTNFSISAIATFDIVAKELNFTRAADVLHITPSAVSHRIKLLEEQLGVQLFIRQSKGVKLSCAGETLKLHVNRGMKNIQLGIQQSQFVSQKNKLVIAVIPSLCQAWLIPRLKSFNEQHQDIELELIVSDQITNFSKRPIDAHLHFGSGEYTGLTAKTLCSEFVYPVCHPSLLKLKQQKIEELLSNTALLHYKAGIEDQPGGVTWADWFQSFNIDKPNNLQHTWFSHVSLAISAAKHQQGVALGWHKIVQDEIDSGQLIRLDQRSIQTKFNYYLVAPSNHWHNPLLNKFYQWLFTTISQA